MGTLHTFPAPLNDETRYFRAWEKLRVRALCRLARSAQKADARAAFGAYAGETARRIAANEAARHESKQET